MGGALQDQVVYNMGYSLNQVQCPAMFTQGSGLFGYSEGCLTQQRWDDLNALFHKTGYKTNIHINRQYYQSFLPN